MIKLKILYEDNHLLCVLKPSNILVQKDKTGDISLQEMCKEYLKNKYNKKGNVFLGILHRLDRPAAGIVLFAKTSKAASRLSYQIKHRKISKIYYIITENIPAVNKNHIKEQILTVVENKKVKVESELSYKVIKKKENKALIKVYLITGKKHQIRIQFSKMKCSVMGDLRYKASKPLNDKSIALLFKKIIFSHPTLKHQIAIETDFPDTYPWNIFK